MPVYKMFTTKYSGVTNKLLTDVVIVSGDKSMTVSAQWDTGATRSCISHDVVRELELVSVGRVNVLTPSGEGVMSTYCIDVVLPNSVRVDGIIAGDSEIGRQDIGMLIGMDIISQGDMAISNVDGKTVFTFRAPPRSVIDFVVATKRDNVLGPPHGTGKRKRKKKK